MAHALYRTAPSEAICPDGERLSDAQRRMIAALHLIGSRHPGETVAAVTHAVMIRLILVSLNVVQGERWRHPIGRGSLTEFHVDGTIQLAALPPAERSAPLEEDSLPLSIGAPLAPGQAMSG
jgi:broad specificity phosphatase PhoE